MLVYYLSVKLILSFVKLCICGLGQIALSHVLYFSGIFTTDQPFHKNPGSVSTADTRERHFT